MRQLIIIAVLAAGILSVVLLAKAQDQPDTSQLKGKPSFDFSLKTFDGNDIKLSAQKGKVVVLDFWATWCPPCRKSLPHLQKVSDSAKSKNGLVVWAINDNETKPVVGKFLKDNKFTFTVPMDIGAKVGHTYQVTGIPTTVIVGRDGIVSDVFIGWGDDSGKAIDDAIDAALAK